MKTKICDSQYKNQKFALNEAEHNYGDKVHILSNPVMQTMLSKFCSPGMPRVELNHYLEVFYRELFFNSCNYLFEQQKVDVATRMQAFDPRGVWSGDIINYESNVVMVDLARAGTQPAFIGHDLLNCLVNPDNIRQDHIYINRKVDDKGHVIGVDVSGSKIGGGQDESYVFFPDPMGATGGSISYATKYYKDNVEGKAKKYIALHLMVTPEYIKKMTLDHPDMEIFTLRLDRGASDEEVLGSVPGTFKDREFGLSDVDYILPGAGGVGEVLNNSYV